VKSTADEVESAAGGGRAVDDPVWTFARSSQTLTLRRQNAEGGVLLVVTENGNPRSYFFDELAKLTRFQVDMEAFLVGSGWTFVSFSPERRSGRDRRTFPRITDRRRWWTDGMPEEPGK
jgi:hypothetical protein